MPAVKPGSKILVTGASGFIAAWVVKQLLDQGFHVRGTVRSTDKGDYLVNLFKDHGDRFEYVVVEDIAKDNAFDLAVKGVDAVAHTASPFHFKAEDPNELIGPAVKGTVGVLESILKRGQTVQRVVITSSLAALIQPADQQQILTETIWNEFSIQEVKNKGIEAAPIHKYRASKTLAERAAWEFVEKHKNEITWDVTALNPPLVWGPTIHELSTAASLNTSLIDPLTLIKGQKDVSATPVGNWIDVRDLAEAHVKALATEGAGGERFLITSGPFTWQDFLDGIHSGETPDPALAGLPKGTPGAGKNVVHPVLLDTNKARKILGMKFRDIGETAKDTVRSLLERGHALGW